MRPHASGNQQKHKQSFNGRERHMLSPPRYMDMKIHAWTYEFLIASCIISSRHHLGGSHGSGQAVVEGLSGPVEGQHHQDNTIKTLHIRSSQMAMVTNQSHQLTCDSLPV